MDMWYALFVYISSQQLSTMVTGSTPNMGYRFKVYPVNICPGNKTAFETAAEKINCTGRYLCAPNKDLSNLIEFCTDRKRSLFLQGNCVRLEGTGDLNHYNCSNFNTGCPNQPYVDDELFKYPACLNISKAFHCFVSENGCILRENDRNGSKRETPNYVLLVVVILFSVGILLATGVIFYWRRKKCRKVTKNLKNEEIDKNKLRQFIKEGHLTICHIRCIIVGCDGAGKTTLLKRLEGATLKNIKSVSGTEPYDIHVSDFEVVKQKTIQRVQGSNIDMKKTIIFSKSDIKNEIEDVEMCQRSNYDKEEHQSKQTEDTYPLFHLNDLEETADDDLKANFQKEATVTQQYNNRENQGIMNDYTVTETEVPTKTRDEKDYQIQTSPDDTSFLSEKRKNDRISFINFGVKHIYYAFHQIYLNPNAIYILVLDMTKGFNEKEPSSSYTILAQFESWTYKDYYTFWLKSIDSFTDVTTPVIVVGTHAENMSLQGRNTFFKEFFALLSERKDLLRHIHSERCFSIELPKNGAKLEDLEKIKACIASIVPSLPQWKEDIKPKWAMFEHLLKNEIKEKIVSRNELSMYNENLDNDFKLSEEEITKLLEYLNRIGSILYHDDENIRNIVILDVQWLVDTFRSIITHQNDIKSPSDIDWKHFHETGELEDHQLDALFEEKKDTTYFSHKEEVIAYMDHFGMLAVCNSKNAIWYYFPSLNKRKFHKEHDTPRSFKPSTILCFQFDEEGQLPIFLFYELVSKCNKVEGWDILVEDKKKCIYENAVCFSYRDIIVIVCICKFQIQVKVFYPPDYDNERIDSILVEIQITMERNIRQFKRYTYEIGYKCQSGELLSEKDNSFIAMDDFPTDRLLCSKCVVSQKHIVENSTCWMQRSRLNYSDISDSEITFENSNANADEGLVSLKRIFHDALTGKMENFRYHLDNEIGERKYLLRILTDLGWNLMHCAAKGGNAKIFEIITRETNDYQMKYEKTYDHMTVLHIAAKYGRYNICKRILESDDFKFLNEISLQGKNACHFAVEGGFIDVLELLIEQNADARATTKIGQNIFHIACIYNHLEMCRYISHLSQFHDLPTAVCTDSWNATLHAAKNGHMNILKFLLEKNVSFTHLSESKRNALHVACDHGHFDACKFIIDSCPSLLCEVDDKGRHAGHFAVRGGNMDILTYLETKMDVTKNTSNGMNILHMACLHCNIKMCAYITKKYPFLNVEETEHGWTTAHFVAERGNNKGNEIEIFRILMNSNKIMNIKTLTKKRNSVLTIAVKCNDYEFVEYLLRFYPELLNIPNVNNPREVCIDNFEMNSMLNKYLS